MNSLSEAMKKLEIGNVLDKHGVLVSRRGTDGESLNICGHSGMRGTMQRALPWLFWAWCCVHQLKLASKNSLTSNLFSTIEEMFLRVYYHYKNKDVQVDGNFRQSKGGISVSKSWQCLDRFTRL